ncbi:MAG: SpoIID/LytB domain-containing protein [Elusimicrobia bacterium]|nr:SpoIID/LytB domain-containing protein [Elusimicrobiota bacterium]
MKWAVPLLALLLSIPLRSEGAAPDRLIQIGIVPGAHALEFSIDGEFAMSGAPSGASSLSGGARYRLEPSEGGLRLGNLELPEEIRLRPKDGSSLLIGNRRYRGDIIVRASGSGQLTAIEEIGIETYLMGVLPHEMDPSWPLEALKSQAVVARTFAYTHLGKYRKMGFDLTSDTRSQVYRGLEEVAPSIREAVKRTRGEVLGWKGEILNVYYHSCCGGHTVDPRFVWGSESKTPDPLRGVRDRYCQTSPHARWIAYFQDSDIVAAVGSAVMGPLRRFAIKRRNNAGYVQEFLVRIAEETVHVPAIELRRALGNTELKSARISAIRRRAKGYELVGQGMGHGVGLCQWGARRQAEKGRAYEKILRYYFPGAILSVIDS